MKDISRRKFVQVSSLSSAFLVIGYIPSSEGKGKVISNFTADLEAIDLNQFISIDNEGHTILFNHRPEMGQGTYQSIPMILAEELEVDIDQVEIKQSIADQSLYGSQMVVGSRSIQTEFDKMRKMGASAREMLTLAAAKIWNTEPVNCTASQGSVIHKDGRVLGYGDLIGEASKIAPPGNPLLKNISEFKIIGKSIPRRDIPLKTNGEAKFGIDISVPGMLYASVERSPVFLGKIKGYNKSEVLKVPGVKQVIQTSREVYGRTREGVAVLADSYWASVQGRKKLIVEWDKQGFEKVSDTSIEKDSMKASK